MAAEPSSAPEAPALQLREAAKWLIGAFGAIAAVVAAGIQFGDVGKLDGKDLAIALAAAGVAFFAITAAMYSVARLLVPRSRTVNELARASRKDPAVKYLEENPDVLAPFDSLDELATTRQHDAATYRKALFEWRENPSDDTAKRLAGAAALAGPTKEVADKVVYWANYQTLKRAFDRSMSFFVLPMITVAAVALTAFAVKVSDRPAEDARRSDGGAHVQRAAWPLQHLNAFRGQPQVHYGPLQRKLCLVRYYPWRGGKDPGARWWTTCEENAQLGTVAEVRERLALPKDWGRRDARVLAAVPKGASIVYLEGHAAEQCEADERRCYRGRGMQLLFRDGDFKRSWFVRHECASGPEAQPAEFRPCSAGR